MQLLPKPLFLFAPGAGAPSTHRWMVHWTELIETIGNVCPFDYPYAAEWRKRPDPLPQLIEAHRMALENARQLHEGPVILIFFCSIGEVIRQHPSVGRRLERIRTGAMARNARPHRR